jgi:hypothetical protein
VTGAAALLQQYAGQQMNAVPPNPQFGDNSLHHEVMKAVLLNSADKLAGVHGSTRTAYDKNGLNWRQTEAFVSDDIPLDDQLGASLLNAKRAVQQFTPGEYDPGTVPLLGWDFDTVGGSGFKTEYVFNSESGGYIAATLTWDRKNEHSGGNTYHYGDTFTILPLKMNLNNLDLYLLPANSNDLGAALTKSMSLEDNVEHIFFDVPIGSYKLVVHNNFENGIGGSQNYALAWWFGNEVDPKNWAP